MLKLTNKIDVLHTWIVFQGIFFTLVSNFKLQIGSIPKKTFKRKLIYHVGGVYNTGLNFSTFFQVPGKWVNYSDCFFPAELKYQSLFFLSHPVFMKFYVKSIKRIINIDIFRQRILYVCGSFSIFFRVTRWIAR